MRSTYLNFQIVLLSLCTKFLCFMDDWFSTACVCVILDRSNPARFKSILTGPLPSFYHYCLGVETLYTFVRILKYCSHIFFGTINFVNMGIATITVVIIIFFYKKVWMTDNLCLNPTRIFSKLNTVVYRQSQSHLDYLSLSRCSYDINLISSVVSNITFAMISLPLQYIITLH